MSREKIVGMPKICGVQVEELRIEGLLCIQS